MLGRGVLLTFPVLGAPERTGEELPALGKGRAAPAHPSCLGRRSRSQGRKSLPLSGRKAQRLGIRVSSFSSPLRLHLKG